MTFVRLAGCSVKNCFIRKECDEAPWKAKERLTEKEIVDRSQGSIVCITGGEPTDHDLLPLFDVLRSAGKRIHMETSGARSTVGYPLEWLTVSPKTEDYVQRSGHTLKVVLRPEWDWSDVDRVDEDTSFFHRYLQPMTRIDGTTNLSQVINMVASVRNNDGRWALSTQAHKSWKVK